ncbi:MAG: ABC transporter ATP-binding protein [Thermoproteota archaeon]|nr:ABC transporter ATP-binding protein [Candidatus Korarchaeota archaeon]RLG42499.1 MAG: ABC transporter ATP-binding protein [Candidatus Korarchaeota archaeon]
MVEVRVVGVTKRFGSVTALSGVNLTVPDGMITAVLGPSGCGKTTLLRVIAGLEKPDEGAIYFGDNDVTDLPTKERNVGMVFQDLALFPHLTVLENVIFGLEARGLLKGEALRIAREYLEIFKLEGLEERYPHQLSGGQQQRVALARALAPEPEILLLDEPFGALDVKLREELLWELRKLLSEKKFTALHVTHDQSEAMAVADRLAIMCEGRIVREGSVEEVISNPRGEFAARFLGANILTLIETSRGVYKLGGIEVRSKPGLKELKIGFYPEDVEIGQGIEVEVLTVSKHRSGYRIKVISPELDEELEVWLKSIPGEKFEIRPMRWFVLPEMR